MGTDCKHEEHCGRDAERQDTWLFLSLIFAHMKRISLKQQGLNISHYMATVVCSWPLESKQTVTRYPNTRNNSLMRSQLFSMFALFVPTKRVIFLP